jgi:hypothetical protein
LSAQLQHEKVTSSAVMSTQKRADIMTSLLNILKTNKSKVELPLSISDVNEKEQCGATLVSGEALF